MLTYYPYIKKYVLWIEFFSYLHCSSKYKAETLDVTPFWALTWSGAQTALGSEVDEI